MSKKVATIQDDEGKVWVGEVTGSSKDFGVMDAFMTVATGGINLAIEAGCDEKLTVRVNDVEHTGKKVK